MPDDLGVFTLTDCRGIKQMLAWWRGRTAKDAINGSASFQTGWYHVKSVQGDYLTCRSWDGTTEGTVDIFIAKPPWLRQTPYNGLTIAYAAGVLDTAAVTLSYAYVSGTQRTVTKAGVAQTQFIVPAYVGTGTGYKGEEIWAAFVGVTGINGGDGKPIRLVEIYSSRGWGKQG